jgi:hypothetical protein
MGELYLITNGTLSVMNDPDKPVGQVINAVLRRYARSRSPASITAVNGSQFHPSFTLTGGEFCEARP